MMADTSGSSGAELPSDVVPASVVVVPSGGSMPVFAGTLARASPGADDGDRMPMRPALAARLPVSRPGDGSTSASVVRAHAIDSAIGWCHATPYSHSIAASPHTPVTVFSTPAGPCVTSTSCAKSQSVSWFCAIFSYATAISTGASSGKPHPMPSHHTRNARRRPRSSCARVSRRA